MISLRTTVVSLLLVLSFLTAGTGLCSSLGTVSPPYLHSGRILPPDLNKTVVRRQLDYGKLQNLITELEKAEQVCEWDENYAAARGILLQELALFREARIQQPGLLGAIYSKMGALYSLEKKFPEAEKSYKIALAYLKQAYGSLSLEVALDLNNLAWSQHQQLKWAEAESSYRNSLYTLARCTDEESIFYGMTACNLAELYLKTGQLRSSLYWFQRALRALSASLGKDDPFVVVVQEKSEVLKAVLKLTSKSNTKTRIKQVPNR